MNQLDVAAEDYAAFVPLASSVAYRATFEGTFHDYVLLTGLIAAAETVFHDFAGSWAKSVRQCSDIDVNQGYRSIHVENESGEAIEGGHSEDAWLLFVQAVTPERYEEVLRKVREWLNVWASFCDDLLDGKRAFAHALEEETMA